jgi:hypothetical protein
MSALLNSEEYRRRAEEADELARKSSDFGARRAYEEVAGLWRDMANAPNGMSGRLPQLATTLFPPGRRPDVRY